MTRKLLCLFVCITLTGNLRPLYAQPGSVFNSYVEALMVEEVWSDDLWRLTTVTVGELAGYSYLTPRRHIPHITDLDGEEATTFGDTVAAASKAIKDETGAELVYAYVFGGGVDHFHVHLALGPDRPEDTVRSFKDIRPAGQAFPCKDRRLDARAAAQSRLDEMGVESELSDLARGVGNRQAQGVLGLGGI